MKRTLLPLNGLRVLDAAHRHRNFTRAADELAVTPAAVGQQVRALEDVLGVVLFRRTPRGLEPTPECEAGIARLRDGFAAFEGAVEAMRAGQASHRLTLAAPRWLAADWLMPRLAAHAARAPDVAVIVRDGDEPPDFAEANIDLALVWGARPAGIEALALGPAGLVRVGTDAGVEASADIGVMGRADAEGGPGTDDDGSARLRVADPGLALAAARAGLGAAWVPAPLVARGVPDADGDADARRAGDQRLWAAAPLPQWRLPKVRALVGTLAALDGHGARDGARDRDGDGKVAGG